MNESYGSLILTLPNGQQKHVTLSKPIVTIGRSTTNDVIIPDTQVSRRHFRLMIDDKGCLLRDLKSVNGTFVNDARVEESPITAGDEIRVGGSTVRYYAVPEPVVTAPHERQQFDMIVSDTSVPRLAVYVEGKTWEVPITGDHVTIGRDDDCDLAIEDHKIARRHAVIEQVEGKGYVISDLETRGETWIGLEKVPIDGQRPLHDGEMIRLGDALIVFKRGLETEALTMTGRSASDLTKERLPVIVVPGFMGSQLWMGEERVWPELKHLLGHPEWFKLEQGQSVTPLYPKGQANDIVIIPGLVEFDQYDRLGNYLEEELGYERGKDLLEFTYDWRLDNRVTARTLGAAIEEWSPDRPVVIIGHSMGCLSARYYVEKLGGHKKVEKLLLLGGPNQGVPMTTIGLVEGPDLIPFSQYDEKLRDVLRTFPSMYQMLPTYPFANDERTGQQINLLEDESWLPEQSIPLLRDARAFLTELGTSVSVPTISVFGYGIKTLFKAAISRNKDGHWRKLHFEFSEAGDNCVNTSSAYLPGSLIHPVWQNHGALYIDNEVQNRLKLELLR